MKKLRKSLSKILFTGLLLSLVLLVGSCENWMSNDDFMSKIESEVHDANASEVSVYVRFANNKMGTTEPQGNTKMKIDVTSKVSAVTNDDYGFVRWAAFSTKDFPTDKQHSSLTYTSEISYNETYKIKELSSSEVWFSNPQSAETQVKILSNRSDIFLIPIVSARPSYLQSVPANGRSGVVKNSSIRIRFSKAIDPASLKDSEGNWNIAVSSSAAVFTDDDDEMEAKDITEDFDMVVSSSGKMLTLTLKPGTELDTNSQITVTLYEGLTDLFGYSMGKNYSFSFTTGTKSDSLAPWIEVLVGGDGIHIDNTNTIDLNKSWNFTTYKDSGDGTATAASRAATGKIESYDTPANEYIFAQRVYDKLNIYVKATDIIGAGENVTKDSNTLQEDNVAYIGIAAKLYTDNDGTEIPAAERPAIPAVNTLSYVSGTVSPNSKIKQLFKEVVPVYPVKQKDPDDPTKEIITDYKSYSGGSIFTYDLSSLPDGLIKVDVWAIDMNSNSGYDLSNGGEHYDIYDNGYKSIFVVKDTTPIDSAAVAENDMISSKSEQAPYYWYNFDTLKTMELFDADTPEKKIVDAGHEKLRSLYKNLMWNFSTEKTASASGWKYIHDEDGNSINYKFDAAKAPSKDGPVDITVFLRDDLGNESEPVILKSIMYDNTAPTVSLLDNYGDFVKASDGSKDLHSSKNAVISQVLKVSFTEPNVDNAGSGIRRIELHVKKGETEVAVPLDENTFKVKWAPETVENPNPATAEEIEIAKDDIASSDTLKVFKVTDAKKITTGTLFIYGITLGEEDGDYTVNVDLYDSAINKTPDTAKTLISRDTTEPVINKVKVASAIARTVYNDAAEEKTWWLPENQFETADDNSKVLTKVTLVVTANEAGSGLEYIKVGNDVEFTAATKLKKGADYLIPETDYHLDVASNTIKLLDNYKAKLKNTNATPIEFTLENVKLKTINNSAANKIKVAVTDFVSNTGSNLKEGTTDDYQIYYDDTTDGTLIYADNTPPAITDLRIEDSAQNTYTNADNKGYNNNYTDSQKVVLLLTLEAEKLSNGSGVKTITLSDNATFSADTEIFVDDVKLESGYSTLENGSTSVTFDKVFVEANKIKFTNVNILNSTNGNQTINADLTDFVGFKTTASKESEGIILDQVSPLIKNIDWEPLTAGADVALGLSSKEIITDQNFTVDFTEVTAGTKVIRFDINHETDAAGAESFATPFNDNLTLTYNNELLAKDSDYTIEDGRYIVLKEPLTSGILRFGNIKLNSSTVEGQYNIKVTLLDAAENKNPQTENVKYSEVISVDKTPPAVNKVVVLGAKPRTVYDDTSALKTWWMPKEKFVEDSQGNKNLSKVDLKIKVKEVGSGIKVIKLADDVEFTSASKLKNSKGYLVAETDFHLDESTHTITLFNYEEPKLKGTTTEEEFEFILENVKLNKINKTDGNAINVQVVDFVNWDGSNIDGSNYKIYYPGEVEYGNFVYADNTAPAIDTLTVEDNQQRTHSAQDSEVWENVTNKSFQPSVYTDSNIITLNLKLVAENLTAGSGVNTIHLSSNAEFTDDTTISVDGRLLTGGYNVLADNKTVTFNNVFVTDNTITFTNVKINDTTNGAQPITATVTDFTGWQSEVKTNNNTIILDTVNPVVSTPVWVVDEVSAGEVPNTEGITTGNIINNQTLEVPFTEVTSGVKVIKMDVLYDNETDSYATPFADDNFVINYVAGNTTYKLKKDIDYTVDTDGRYIILADETKYKSNGTNKFTFHGIKIRDADAEGNYTIKVTLQDGAERIGTNNKTIAIDTVAPNITEDIIIPNLISAYQLTTSGVSTTKEYWLPASYVNGTAKSPDSIPVYVKIKENGSGIKVISFGKNATLSANTTLWIVASDGTENAVLPSYYSVENNTITIDSNNALNKGAVDDDFEILVKNVGFANIDSAYGATNAHKSENTINVKVSDVAKNDSNARETSETPIYSDSRIPAAPTGFKLLDRAYGANGNSTDGAPSIQPSENYTNDSIVNMEFNLDTSEVYGSGYHAFQITNENAVFTANTSITMTRISPSGSGTINGISFVRSEDNKILTLKTSGENSNNLVVRDAVKVTITNVQLLNDGNTARSGDNISVSLRVLDLVGRESTVASDSIYFDNTKPELYKLFAANYNKNYYVSSVNVYPHAYEETAEGILVNYGTTSSPKNVPTFYTATSYESGLNTYNGQVSKSSTALDQTFTYGAVLGFHATDNLKLGGYVRSKTFLHYVQDTNFTKTAADILGTSEGTNISTSRFNPTQDINGGRNLTSGNNSATNESLWFGIPAGKYSAVIVDEAGNVSDVFHFAVVQDTTKPDTDIQNRVLLERPDESYNIYRNTTVTTDSSTEYKAYASTSTSSIRTKKYVTKQASDKYKIVLNLGSTYSNSSLVSKLNGTSASTVSEYSELKATSSSAPIESYAISTWYGSWPTSTSSTSSYVPVVPYNTKFPSGQALESSSLNDSYALMACNYFDGDSSFKSRWRMLWDSENYVNGVWPSFSKNSSKYTDTRNKITSYIDSNNNLIIEVPNDRSTAPISVFLRDGCGNMNFVVLGLETSGGLETAVSITLDNKLAWKTTANGDVENGHVKVPFILQAPYSYYSTSSDSDAILWGSDYIHFGYQSGNIETGAIEAGQNGDHEKFGFIQDHVKKATYYNPNITNGTNTNVKQFKFGFAMHFWEPGKSSSSLTREDITFPISQKSELATQAQINAGEYSLRGLMYCTNEDKEISYEDIINCYNAEKARTDKTGQVSEWTYVRISNKSTDNEALIFLDYPCPNYERLGWIVQNSKGEPEPYYIWYIIEDRVGNYELAKVVNSQVKDSESERLVKKHSETSSYGIFDRWLYDGTGPKLTIRDTTIEPNTIASSQTAVNDLVATNNGYVPYLSGSNTVYVRVTDGTALRHDDLKNPNLGYGTTHYVEEADYGRRYEPFMDLQVSEITGVRAFAWSNSETPPDRSYTDMNVSNNRNTHGDNGWYAGYKATSQYADIGCNFLYGYSNVAGTSGSGNAENSYFSFTNSSSSYKGVYSGTKVNTVIPKAKLSESTSKQLWLHVMDWTGNVSSYRMGSSLVFKNDISGPSWAGSTNTDTTSVDEEYYVTSQLKVVIAGNSQGSSTNQKEMHVHFPTSYFNDSGSGYAGMVFGSATKLTVSDIKTETFNNKTDSYLLIPYTEYSSWPETCAASGGVDHIVQCYCFDNVGNYYNNTTTKFTGVYDTTPPSIASVSFVTEKDQGTEFVHTSTDAIKTVSGYGKVTDFTAKEGTTRLTSTASLEAGVTAGTVQEIWVNQTGTSRFHINLTSEFKDDLDDVIINKWSGSAWTKVSSWKSDSATWNHDSDDVTYRPNSFTLLDFTAAGTYYQIITKDLAGNCCYQYFKLYLDNVGPTLATRTTTPTSSSTSTDTTNPIVELGKGSINSVKVSGVDTYYYTAGTTDAEKLKIHFAMKDDSIPYTKQKLYYGFGFASLSAAKSATTGWTEVTPTADGSIDETASFSSGTIQKIYLKDVLGNVSEITPTGYDYTYTNSSGTETTIPIPKLTKYTGSTPAEPSFTYSNYYSIEYSTQIETSDSTGDYGWDKYQKTEFLSKNAAKTEHNVLIKDTARKSIKISFTPANTNIKGFVKMDTSTLPSTEAGTYSFADLATVFEEDLPENPTKDTTFTRYYYAVDVIGNISSAQKLIFSYNNPHQAQDIEFIADPLSDENIPDNLKTAIQKGTIKIVKTYDTTTRRYFNDDYFVVRCTLYQQGGEDYNDTPVQLKIKEYYDNVLVTAKTTDDTLRVYNSDKQNSNGRYYCYLVFKFGDTIYDNASGNSFNCQISGSVSTSEWYYLNDSQTTWMRDTDGPVIGSKFADTGDNVQKLKGYAMTDRTNTLLGTKECASVSKAYDNSIGENYGTNIYTSGSSIYLQEKKRTNPNNASEWYVRDVSSGIAKYKFVKTDAQINDTDKKFNATASASDSDWVDVDYALHKDKDGNDVSWIADYKFNLPDVTVPHTHLALFLMDNVGNVSVPYYLGNASRSSDQWWLVEKTLSADDIGITRNESTLSVQLPHGTIVKSVDVTQTNKADNTTATSVDSVSFEGYSKDPALNKLSDGWVIVKDGAAETDNVGMTVTLKDIPGASWQDQVISLKINGVEKKAFTVDAKELTSNDISINTSTSTGFAKVSWNKDSSTYELPIKLKNGAGIGNIKTIEVEPVLNGVTVDSWRFDKVIDSNRGISRAYVTIKGVPGKDWTAQDIKLKVNENDNIVKKVLTIPAIEAEDIHATVSGDVTYDEGLATIPVTISIDGKAASTKIDSAKCSTSYGELELDDSGKGNIKAYPNWDDQDFSLTIHEKTGIKVESVNDNVASDYKLPKIDDSAISVTNTDGTDTEYSVSQAEYTFKVNVLGLNKESTAGVAMGPVIENTSVSVNENATLNSKGWDSENSQYKVNISVSQDWSEKPVKLTVHTITKDIFTVKAKTLNDGDVDLTPVTYVKGTEEYTVPLNLKGTKAPPIERLVGQTFTASKSGVNVELVTDEDGKPALNAGGKYELKLTGVSVTKDWEEKYITVAVSGDKVTSDALKALQAIKIEAINADDIEVKQLVTENGEEVEKTLSWDNVEFDSERSKTFKIKVKTPGDIDYNKLTVSGAELLDSDGKVKADTTDKEVIIRATPDWGSEAAPVSLTINADENGKNGMVIQDILSVPAISADDLYVSIADWNDTEWDNKNKTKTPVLTFSFPRGRENYDGLITSVGSIQAVQDPQNPSIQLPGLAMSPDWEDKTYDITFTFKNGAQYVVEGYEIPAITKDEIFITQIVTSGEQTPDYASGKQDGDYRVFVLQLSAPKDIPADSVTTNYGTVTFDATTQRATLSVKEGWTANTVILSIKDTDININTGITVPANTNKNLEEDEILWTAATWDAESPSYEIPFTLVDGAKLDDISLTTNNDAVDATLDTDNHKIVLSKHNAEAETWLTQGWKNQIINVKFAKGETELFTKKALVIPHKSLNVDEDIKITDKDQGYPTNNYYISFKITIPNDLEISDFSSSNGTMKKNNDGYKIDGEMSASTTITLTLVLKNTTTKVCTVTKNLYSVGGSVEFMSINSRFASLTGKLKKLSDNETSVITSETPKTQSISLFNWVTDLFENNEETASNVSAISDATPVKTAKKAAKAAIPAVTETSPFSNVIAESAVAARSITNEPVEKVVETVAAKNAQMVVSAGSIVETETSVITDSIVDSMEEADSTDVKALIWTLIAALSAALITAGAVFYRKRHKA